MFNFGGIVHLSGIVALFRVERCLSMSCPLPKVTKEGHDLERVLPFLSLFASSCHERSSLVPPCPPHRVLLYHRPQVTELANHNLKPLEL